MIEHNALGLPAAVAWLTLDALNFAPQPHSLVVTSIRRTPVKPTLSYATGIAMSTHSSHKRDHVAAHMVRAALEPGLQVYSGLSHLKPPRPQALSWRKTPLRLSGIFPPLAQKMPENRPNGRFSGMTAWGDIER